MSGRKESEGARGERLRPAVQAGEIAGHGRDRPATGVRGCWEFGVIDKKGR